MKPVFWVIVNGLLICLFIGVFSWLAIAVVKTLLDFGVIG